MTAIEALHTGQTLLAAISNSRAAIRKAEEDLAKLRAASEAGEKAWADFATANPTLAPIVEAAVAALEAAGLIETIKPAEAADEKPVEESSKSSQSQTPASGTADDKQPASTAGSTEPEKSAGAKASGQPEIPAVQDKTPTKAPPAPRKPKTASESQTDGRRFIKTGMEEMHVGPMNTLVPNKPKDSPSTKSNANYKAVWAQNYQAGFDDEMEDKPERKLRAGEGPAREGYFRGREDAVEFKNRGDVATKTEPAVASADDRDTALPKNDARDVVETTTRRDQDIFDPSHLEMRDIEIVGTAGSA